VDKLPVIDIAPLNDTDTTKWQSTIEEIDHALRTYGFMYIKGHGIEKQQTERLYSAAREFFSLPEQIKQAVSIQKSDGYRGWSPLGSEKLEKGLPADLKESFDVGDDRPSDHPDSKFGQWWAFERPLGLIANYRENYEICYQWSPLDTLISCTLKPAQNVVVGTGKSAECSEHLSYKVSDKRQIYIGNASQSLTDCSLFDAEFQWR